MSLNKSLLGRKIRYYRKRMGWTQTMLMEKLGYTSDGMISQVEAGLKGMEIDKIILAAEVFNVDPIVFLSNKDYDDDDMRLILGLFTVLNNKGKRNHRKFMELQNLLISENC